MTCQLNAIGSAGVLGAIGWAAALGARSLKYQQPHSLYNHAAMKIFCPSIFQRAYLLKVIALKDYSSREQTFISSG
jgi:hypothetical protein